MALLDIFKGKKGKFQKHSEKRGKRKVKEPISAPKKEVTPEVKEAKPLPQTAKAHKRDIKIAPRVLKSPQITEKATFLREKNQFVFKVFSTATKPEIKKSIEEVYGVKVQKVRVINVPKKVKRLGRSRGFTSGYKKAIITLNKGQTIEVVPR